MLHKVQSYAEEYHMFDKNDRVVAGVSGGADSMCLLSVLLALAPVYDLSIVAVHVNHELRGKEADEEEDYVRQYCEENHVTYKGYHIDVGKLAKEQGWSEEEAGRNARYQAFSDAAEEFCCNKIAVAHHKKDSAETVLLHLFRGSGIRGMCGIWPVRENIIRPLLFAEKEEIIGYLTEMGIRWFTDATNLTNDYARNKIRNRILTYAESEINTKASVHIADFAVQMQEVYEVIEKEAKKGFQMSVSKQGDAYFVSKQEFITFLKVIQKEILFILFDKLSCFGRKNITSVHIADILSLFGRQTGRRLSLPGGLLAQREYEGVLFLKAESLKSRCISDEKSVPGEVSIPGEYKLKNGQILRLFFINYKKNMIIPKNKYTKWFDYDKIMDVVKIRTRCESDYIIIHKDGGRKSLKSVFIDLKLPREDRGCVPLLADGSHILWIPGIRCSEGCLIDDTTRKVLAAELIC